MRPTSLFALGLAATALGAALQHQLGHGLATQHLAWGLAGAAAFAWLTSRSPAGVRRAARPVLLAALALSLASLLEVAATGSSAWTGSLQPGTWLAVATPFGLASEACRPAPVRRPVHWGALLFSAVAPVAALLALGQITLAAITAATAAAVVWAGGLTRTTSLLGAAVVAVGAPIAFAFGRPELASAAANQSGATAIAVGGWTGVGPGAGAQARLGLLPGHAEGQMLAHIAEELGFVGAMLVLGTVFAMAAAAFVTAELARDRFTALLCTGTAVLMVGMASAHAAAATGLLPAHAPLPFFSLGPLATLPGWVALGSVASLARGPRPEMAPGTVGYGPNEVVPSWESILAR